MASIIHHNPATRERTTLVCTVHPRSILIGSCIEQDIDDLDAPWSEPLEVRHLRLYVRRAAIARLLGISVVNPRKHRNRIAEEIEGEIGNDERYLGEKGWRRLKRWLKQNGIPYREFMETRFIDRPSPIR